MRTLEEVGEAMIWYFVVFIFGAWIGAAAAFGFIDWCSKQDQRANREMKEHLDRRSE